MIAQEQAYADAERRLGRKLHASERAIDIPAVDRDLEAGKEQLVNAIEAEKRRAIRALKLSPFVQLRVSPAMLDALLALYDSGRRHALDEMRRLGVPEERLLATEDELPSLQDVIDRLRQMLTAIQVRVGDEEAKLRVGQPTLTEDFLRKLEERVPGARDVASRLISTAMTRGLLDEYSTRRDLFPCWIYTAVLDAATCTECRPLDGTRFTNLEEALTVLPGFGPNPFCLGDGRCRCRLVPCPPAGVEGAPPSPVPEPPPPVEPPPPPEPELPEYVREARAIREKEWLTVSEAARRAAEQTMSGYDDYLNAYYGDDYERRSPFMRDQIAEVERVGQLLADEIDRRVEERLVGIHAERERVDRLIEETEANSEQLALDQAVLWADRPGRRGVGSEEDLRRFMESPEWIASEKAVQDNYDRLATLRGERVKLRSAEARVRSDESLNVLREVRDFGGAEWDYTTAGRKSFGKQRMDAVAKFYPTDWIQATEPIVDHGIVKRGWESSYTHRERGELVHEIALSKRDASQAFRDENELLSPVALHELGHAQEGRDERIRSAEAAWYQKRTRGGDWDGEQEKPRQIPGYKKRELYRPDDFVANYMGKTYGDRETSTWEVFTVGIESLFLGSYELDAEYRAFMLGLLVRF